MASTHQRDDVWIGADIGTQSVRVLAVTGDGDVVGSGTAPLHSIRSGDGGHEQLPDEWWRALGTAAREAAAGIDPARLRAVALCATSGTVLLTDTGGAPVGPALMYNDARAEAEARRAASGHATWRRLGYTMQPTWGLPKLLWLLGRHPGRHLLAHQADHLTARLTGHRTPADSSHALKTGYDVAADRWPTEVLDTLGVDPAVLPDVVAPGTVVGRIGAAAAEHTGLPEGLAVKAGMTDGCAAQIAAGALAPGQWNSVLGSTLVLKGVTPELLIDPGGALYNHRHPDGGWLPGGASNVGAAAVAARFPGADLAALDAAAAQRPHPRGLVYPLTGHGERFPFVHPGARPFATAAFADDVDHYNAVLHGVAYIERLSLDRLAALGARVEELSFTGGGARSPQWTRLRADVLQKPVRIPAQPEPAFGMAVLAASDGSLTETAAAMVRTRAVVAPRPDRADQHDDGYRRLVGELAARGYLDRRPGTETEETA
ncbi:sugar (pentulose or hexulose) kinase [Murinocardiopsis flavida]|uniref:Sugar (Pentulose or hexulose) kinase n=1 Tax=Murinocardiopsis flavida TaxID=645275 RepID=A0A2P8DQ40_9ACTN|nr:FGGY family carbohydrate kinase [Murinocardiopsis flavida]PSK99314.1 sugar (pentulose or hexulose) kinase [Murinocardiopsis flavida]